MKIKYEKEEKAIGPFVWEDIPHLSIITGLNGVGKSQLLLLLRNNPDLVQTDDGINYKHKDIVFWNSHGGGILDESNSFQISDLVMMSNYIKNYFSLDYLNDRDRERGTKNVHDELLRRKINILAREGEIKQLVESNSGKSIIDLGLAEIMYYFPDEIFWDSKSINLDRIEVLFFLYHFRRYIDKNKNKDTSTYEPPPWVLLNEVFETSNLPFEVNNPSEISIDFKMENVQNFVNRVDKNAYSLKLTHKESNIPIAFRDLSGGERIIMSLAFLNYYAQKKNSYRKLLLLDEPDAHLHPSFTDQFLKVIDKFLIQKYGASVIMTTHSPSTIGLCDPDSIFIMSRKPTKIEKQTRASAIAYLTNGLPILSSIIENRRYVLVEDDDDVTFYTLIYKLINNKINKDISLIFISVSDPKNKKDGGHSVVESWTKKLRKRGEMNLLRGLIDRDKSNSPHDGIFVLQRYSMENYLVDPIIVAGFLVQNGYLSRVGSIDFPNKKCYILDELLAEDLQKVADYIVGEVENNFTQIVDKLNLQRGTDKLIRDNSLTNFERDKIPVTFENGLVLNYPNWLFNKRGHDLEDVFRELFQTRKTLGLKELLDIHERLPKFIPIDLIQTFRNLL